MSTTTDALRKVLEDADACFEAARIEGLAEALAETQDARLKDLVERRLLWAQQEIQSALAALSQQAAQEPITYTVDGVVMSPLEYIDYLHGKLREGGPAEQEKAQATGCGNCPRDTAYGPGVCGKCLEAEQQAPASEQEPGPYTPDYLCELLSSALHFIPKGEAGLAEDLSALVHNVRTFGLAALRSEQAPAREDLIALLREIRPQYGAPGSRDVDVAEKQRKIDAAIAALSTPPAVPPGWKLVPDYKVGMHVKFQGVEFKIFANGDRPGTFDLCHPTKGHLHDRFLNVPPDLLEPLSAAPAAPQGEQPK